MTNKNVNLRFRFAILMAIIVLLNFSLKAQIADDKCKFLGNVIASSVPNDFSNYWNQVTPENGNRLKVNKTI